MLFRERERDVFHRVGGDDQAVVAAGVRPLEIPLKRDIDRELANVVAIAAARDLRQPDPRLSVGMISQHGGHDPAAPLGSSHSQACRSDDNAGSTRKGVPCLSSTLHSKHGAPGTRIWALRSRRVVTPAGRARRRGARLGREDRRRGRPRRHPVDLSGRRCRRIASSCRAWSMLTCTSMSRAAPSGKGSRRPRAPRPRGESPRFSTCRSIAHP